MKLYVYGITKENINFKEYHNTEWKLLVAEFDGINLKLNNYTINEIEDFDYLHIHNRYAMLQHIPKRFNKNFENKIKISNC